MKTNLKSLLLGLVISITAMNVQAQSIIEAKKALSEGNTRATISICGPLYKSNPKNLEVLMTMGNAYALLGYKDSAAAKYSEYSWADPDKSQMKKVAEGKELLMHGNKVEAKKIFEEAILKSRSKDAKIAHEISYGYLSPLVRNYDEAIYYLNKSKEIEYKNVSNLILLGDAYLAQNDAGNAMNNYEAAMSIEKSSGLLMKMGQISINAKNYDDAVMKFQQALSLDPNNASIYDKLGQASFLNKQFNKAKEYFKKYAELRPEDPNGKLRFVNYMFVLEDYNELKLSMPEFLAADPNNYQLNRLMGYACYETGDYDNALNYMNKFFTIANGKDTIRDYMYLGKAQIKTKNDSMGIITLNKVLMMDPTRTELYNELADAYFKRKQWNEAINAYQNKFKNVEKPTATDMLSLGRCYYFVKDYINADTTFSRVISMIPNQTFGYLWKAKTNVKMDDAEKPLGLAEPSYLKYIEIAQADIEKNKKDMIDAYSKLGFIYYSKKNITKAREMYQNVLNLDPENKDAKNNMEALR